MGHTRKRLDRDGNPRYTAYYNDHLGKKRSAGTYNTKKEANRAWHAAETKVSEGRSRHLVKGRQRFRDYVEQTFLPNHNVELTTMTNYIYALEAHILDCFGDMRMAEIYPDDIRAWITELKSKGLSNGTIAKQKTVLSAVFSSAFNDEVIVFNPCHRVKIGPVQRKALTIVTPEEFDRFHEALPDDQSKLVVEVAISTGLRWGELSELRPKDFDFARNLLTVSRSVVSIPKKHSPTGERFHVKDYPKDGERRSFKVDPAVVRKIERWVKTRTLAPEDLLFRYDPQRSVKQAPEPSDLGWTKPNAEGRTYRHGTASGYNAGKCRCRHCKSAIAAYRALRRASGLDNPRQQRRWDTDGHLPGEYFREQVIKPALKEAGIQTSIRMHLLRHAHASWLLSGGADLQVVKERLGHSRISTTERYLHALADADETALEAFNKVRSRSNSHTPPSDSPEVVTNPQSEPSAESILAEMARLQAELSKLVSRDLPYTA
jgi:site-specific recombinase XerD